MTESEIHFDHFDLDHFDHNSYLQGWSLRSKLSENKFKKL